MTWKLLARSAVGVVAGIIAISAVVEGLEFGLVTLINGASTTDPEAYYAIRNRPWFLMAKLVYNTAAAVGGGYLAVLLAGRKEVAHGIFMALLQTVAFLFALSQPDIKRWTPVWMWVALIALTFLGILAGARLRAARPSRGLTSI